MRQKTLEFARHLGRLRCETWIRRGDSLGRRTYLPWLACAVLAAITVPAIARGAGDDPAAAEMVVTDGGFRDASGSDPADNSVRIVPGGKVTFSYPSGNGMHNVAFVGEQPTSCRQTAGPVWGAVPPLPWYTQGPGWAGECTFAAGGTYSFRDQGNYDFRGTVIVSAATPTPTATPSPSPTPTASPTPSPTASPTPTATASPTPTPTSTPGGGAEIDARDTSSSDTWFQDASSPDKSDNSVTVKPGDSVTFKWGPAGQVHNVNFKNSALKPAACVQTSGTVILTPPPLPTAPLTNWSGSCRFDAPGTYTFVCDAHPAMTGSVVVTTEGGATTTPTPTASPTPTATPPPRDTTPAPTPKAWASLRAPSAKLSTVPKFANGKLQVTAYCAHFAD